MRKPALVVVAVCAALAITLPLALGAGDDEPAPPQRLVIKVCNWTDVVPAPALDGFEMPAGKWRDYQVKGWHVESYIVAPNESGKGQGFYAILKR
jgi:hypothetical protein